MTLLSVIIILNNINAESNMFNNDTMLHAHTLDTIVHRTNITQTSAQVKVGHSPISVIVNDDKMSSKIYIANSGSNSISVIDGTNNIKLKDIPVGTHPVYMALYPPNKIFVANSGSDSISVIDTITNTNIKNIPVGGNPDYIAVDERQQKIYVANEYGGISVIDAGKNIKTDTIERIPPTCFTTCIANATAIGPSGFTMFTVVRNGISVYHTGNESYIKTIETGRGPSYILSDQSANTIYVANSGNDSISVIRVNVNDNSITKVKDIKVGQRPSYIGSYNTQQRQWRGESNTIYVANSGSDSISVIDGNNLTKIKDIKVGKHPDYISFNIFSNTIYVANSGSNSISVIDGTNNVKLKDIPVGIDPVYMDTSKTNTIYVANSGSDSISVIDGVDNKVVAGVEFNINPSNSGHITCNNIDSPINQYLYVSSGENCSARPNKGFEFSNWIENLGNNATRTVLTSTISGSPLNFFLDIFGIKPNDTSASLNVTQFGNFTANFKALPPPIPPEYWIPLYGVIVSTIVGGSIPGIIGSIKAKRQRERINQYHKRIDSLDSDGKLDENDIEYLDTLRRDITDAYMKGKISEQQASNLKNEISKTYEDIYKNIIHSLNSKFDSSGNGIDIDKIKNDFTNAYAA